MTSDRAIEQALEELYSSEPSEFTKKRDALAKALKKAGNHEGAATIASRRKPTQIAYVLNQLAREHPEAVAELVDVGRALAREQRRALRGEAARGLRDTIERQRKAIGEVGQKAAAVMTSLGVDPAAHLQEVTTALQAALIDPAVGAALEAGQLEKAPEAAVGFGGPMTAAAPPEPDSEPAPAAAPAPRPKKKSEQAEEEKERQRARAAHAKRVAEARAVLAAAEAEARDARTAAERAATEAKTADLVAQKARDAASRAAREAKRLASELTTAERTAAAAARELSRLEAAEP